MGFSVPAAIASRRIRERWLAEDQIRYLAMHDSLTGLPNRLQLRQHLDRAVARSKRHGHLMAVFCLDLDRFKDVNDTLGHPTGDALLAEVSARLRESVREVDLVGRLGGDEFAIVAEDLEAPEDAMRLARRVCTALGETYHVNGHEVTSSASIGIAIGPLDNQAPETLLKNADLALYRAKEDGRNTFRFFEPAMDAALQKRRRLENDLRNALRKNQLYLDYQPQFDLVSGRLTGYEALVRWWHPSEGEVPPTTFIPIAEETGLIVPLGEWILKTACAYATTWPDDTKLAVNLSPAQFKTQDIYGLVRPAAARARDHRGIILQNTDAVSIRSPPRPARRIDRHGRFRHRLFQPFHTPLPGQDRSLLHRYAGHQSADLGHRLEHRRPRPVAQRDDHRRGGGDGRPSRHAEEVGLRSSAGLLLRQARRGRAGIRGNDATRPKVA